MRSNASASFPFEVQADSQRVPTTIHYGVDGHGILLFEVENSEGKNAAKQAVVILKNDPVNTS